MARFDRDPDAGGEAAQALVEKGGVGVQRGRELEQDRAQSVAEPGGVAQQSVDRLRRVAQPFDVRQIAARLEGDDEVGRVRSRQLSKVSCDGSR